MSPPPPSKKTTAKALVDTGSASSILTAAPPPSGVFECSEESALFSRGVRRFLQREAGATKAKAAATIRAEEFGAGDGQPVLAALSHLKPPSAAVAVHVTSFDLCPVAAACARRNAASFHSSSLPHRYDVRCGDFFLAAAATTATGDGRDAEEAPLLLANPPYVPAPSADGLLLPGLFGGRDGADVTRRLLALPRYRGALLVVAGVAAPESVLEAARSNGFRVVAFEAERLPFGTYTSQPTVRAWIDRLESEGVAHTLSEDGGGYVCAAVEFSRCDGSDGDGDNNGDGDGNGNGDSDGRSAAADAVEARLLEALTATRWDGGAIFCDSA